MRSSGKFREFTKYIFDKHEGIIVHVMQELVPLQLH